MLTWILSFLSGPLLNGLVSAYKAKLQAASSTEAHAVDLAKSEIMGEVAMRQAASAIVIAEQGHWYTAIVRPLLAYPVIIYMWKVIVWDKVLGWGTTDPINGAVGDWAGWVIVAYVGGRSLEKVASIFGRKR